MNTLNLTAMKAGTSGTVVQILGGHGMVRRLDALGIRPGVQLTKRSSQLMRGPITVAIGYAQIAIGFGMAKHIILQPKQQE